MKKIFASLAIMIAAFSFVSCDFLGTTLESTTERDTTQVNTTEIITTTQQISTTQTMTTQQTTQQTTIPETTTLAPVTTETTTEDLEPFTPTGYSLLQDELDYVGIPSIGSPKVLVFAVDFSDYTSEDYGLSLEDIGTVFNGSKSEMDFESLNSFYLSSSYGKLNLTADVFGYYRAEETAEYYEDEYSKLWAVNPITGEYIYDYDEITYPESDIIYDVLEYYDDQIDYTDYDYNNDGYIDGVYIVYTHPVSYSSGSDIWWAYQDYYAYDGSFFDGVEPLYLCWSGMEFMTEGDDDLNARTIIHESGHMMGLDDYYDYDDSDNYNEGGLAGADMMDSALGDHGPFSKLLLGWVTPIVVESSMTLDVLPFASDGEVILVTDHWNGSIFDEYFLISLYTPTGLFRADKFYYFSSAGVMIYHVSAEIGNGYLEDSSYYTIFNNNNTDTQDKVVKYIEADEDNSVERLGYTEDADLFQVGDTFGDDIYGAYKWYDNSYTNIDISVLSVSLMETTIRIEFN